MFELYNLTATAERTKLDASADAGKLSKEEYIQAMIRAEHNVSECARAFYVNFFLPWLRSKDLNTTNPRHWYCDSFEDPENLRANFAFEGNSVYLSFYENSYDIKQAYLEDARGNFNGAKTILTRVLANPAGLADLQRSYARGLLAWAKQNSGDTKGAIDDFTASLNDLTRLLQDDPQRVEILYPRNVIQSAGLP